MEDKIKKYILKKHPSYFQLLEYFEIDEEELQQLIFELESNGVILKVKDKYFLTTELGYVPATIASIKEKYAFATISEDNDVYIDILNLSNAFIGDTVLLKRISDINDYKEEYAVVKVLKRAFKEVVGEVNFKGKDKVLLLDNKIVAGHFNFYLNDKDLKVSKNQIVKAVISKYGSKDIFVKVVEVLGNKFDLGMDVARIILSNGAPLTFPEEVLEQVKKIPEKVLSKDKIDRENFTDHLIVTIDGDDAKDFDDAVEVVKVDDIYYVGVHIADVSYYVKEDSPLDKEALNRATSLYVQDRVVPMLPFELSNGICSLNPNVERLATSCLFSIDKKGKILTRYVCKSVIKSKHRLTYNYVNKFLNEERHLKNEYNELEKLLINLDEVSSIIRKKRNKRGNIELNSTELSFGFDNGGEVVSVTKRVQDVGEKLIEDLMITANEIVASMIEEMKLPMIYRIHEHPKAKKLESLIHLSLSKGYPINIDILNCKPKNIQEYLSTINDEIDKEVISSFTLRCLAKAKYSLENKKHFGLASSCYTHFTSPIRRYPDLIVHRLVEKYLIKKNVSYSKEFVASLALKAQLSSLRERRALSISRTVEGLLSAKYMKRHLGDEYDAKIVSITPFVIALIFPSDNST